MKSGIAVFRAIVVAGMSLALAACVGSVEDEAAVLGDEDIALEEQAAAQPTVEKDYCGGSCGVSCGSWSGWCATSAIVCSPRLACGTNCGDYGECSVNLGSYIQESRQRDCTQNGVYVRTEYEYRQGPFLACGC